MDWGEGNLRSCTRLRRTKGRLDTDALCRCDDRFGPSSIDAPELIGSAPRPIPSELPNRAIDAFTGLPVEDGGVVADRDALQAHFT